MKLQENMETLEFRLGQGKISGYLAVLMGALALGTVVCFHYPSMLSTPQLRANLSYSTHTDANLVSLFQVYCLY